MTEGTPGGTGDQPGGRPGATPGGTAREELLRRAEALRAAARQTGRATRDELLQQAELLREAANAAAWSTVDEFLEQAGSALWSARRRAGRGREAAKQRTREEILRAAREVFTRKGFHGASVDDVAAAAGFTKGAVYSNFSSKDDLFLALLDERWEREAELWARTFSRAPTPAAAWAEVARRHADDAATEEHGWDLLSVEFYLYAMRVPAARERIQARVRQARDGIAEVVAAHYERAGAEPPMPVPELVVGLMAIETGLGFHLLLDPDAVGDHDALAATLATRLLGPDPRGEPPGSPGQSTGQSTGVSGA